jgi:AcrR family transcriptional regulator
MPKIGDQERAARRQRFIDAAWRCLSQRGYRDTTVEAVCEEAGASKGAFYGYFASKQELLVALLDDQAGRLDQAAAAAGERGLQGLRAFTRETLREAQDPARVQLRADVFAAVAGDPELRSRLATSVAHRRTLLRQAVEEMARRGQIAEPTRANAVASILLALADGLLLHRALDEKAFRWENVSAVVDRLLDGLVPAQKAES